MSELVGIEDTLYVPMLGRLYASVKFPKILKDDKALDLKPKLPKEIKGQDTQTQYTLLAGAVRSKNMDRYIENFLDKNPDGVIALIGCGLETTYYRIKDKKQSVWYEIDLPRVIEYREKLLPEENMNEHYIKGSCLEEDWLKKIRLDYPDRKILVVASGLFYYFKYEEVMKLFKFFKQYKNIEIVFDIVNTFGMSQMSKYMEQVGHSDCEMYFCVDKAKDLATKCECELLNEEAYYKYTPKEGLDFSTKMTMRASDLFKIVKMVHLKFD